MDDPSPLTAQLQGRSDRETEESACSRRARMESCGPGRRVEVLFRDS